MFVRIAMALLFVFSSQPIGYRSEIGSLAKIEIPVPPTIMLHSSSVDFLPEFLDLIEEEGYTTTTYKEFSQMIDSWEFPTKKLLIISIDDYGPYRVRAVLRTMAEELKSRGMVAVLGLVATEGIDKDTWDYLRSLEDAGFEIASHSVSHAFLPDLSDAALRTEIRESYDLIAAHLSAPGSFVLPYGGFDGDQRIIRMAGGAGYKFVVGIAGSTTIKRGSVYYVGRVSPYLKQPEKTLTELERQFPGWLKFTLDQKILQEGECVNRIS